MTLTRDAVISECLKFHGWGERFARTDGLEQEESRRALRERLLAGSEVRPAQREAVLRAEVTPGMRKSEVTAAWGTDARGRARRLRPRRRGRLDHIRILHGLRSGPPPRALPRGRDGRRRQAV